MFDYKLRKTFVLKSNNIRLKRVNKASNVYHLSGRITFFLFYVLSYEQSPGGVRMSFVCLH